MNCRWCGKQIKRDELRITLTHRFHYDHSKCNEERVKSIKERHGINVDYTHGQRKLI